MVNAQGPLFKLRRRFPRAIRLVDAVRPRVLWLRLRWLGRGREEVFTDVYETRLWDASESASGGGSTLKTTASIREALPEVLASLGVRSLLDAPCGDFHWMREVDLDLDLYVGGDIVRPLVERLNERYGSATRRFVHLDVTCDPLPEADAILCRDCLLHLSNAEVSRVLDNVLRSPCAYLLASHYPACTVNVDVRTGLTRPVNLCRPPFDLPEPIRTITESIPNVYGKCLGVWDLRRIREQRLRS